MGRTPCVRPYIKNPGGTGAVFYLWNQVMGHGTPCHYIKYLASHGK
jgi:hypothetical protein